jgi:hypothetical protein
MRSPTAVATYRAAGADPPEPAAILTLDLSHSA